MINPDGEDPVVLTGCGIEVNGALFTITVPAAIHDDGLSLFLCNPNGTQGNSITHSLPASGVSIRLLNAAGQAVDSITYPAMSEQISGGRLSGAPGTSART